MNAKQRCKLRRLERRSEERNSANAERRLASKIATTLSGCSERTVKALSLPTPRAAKELEVEVKRSNHRIWYKDTNPLGSKIHAVQKSRGKSIPLI
ncbi:regulator [Hafnia alvei]|uniref:regulator n=1 Tax=Hafnia TaxID=568 RepID=UPI000B6BEC2A|nr:MULTISPECIES: regulator [Hafnia]MBI0277119.1 regulator [Hafnia alvei]PNL03451.1 regulator [Hafnia alvei]TBL55558.1 regulator [Hafnia paralvei]